MAQARKSGTARPLPAVCFHLVDPANWASIQAAGLMSATRLMIRSGMSEPAWRQLSSGQRTARVTLSDGSVLRDQQPMPPSALANCLVGASPAQWYELLNSKVFFWFDVERLERMRRAAGGLGQIVLVLDTHRLLMRYEAQAALTPINTGSTLYRPAPRSPATFVPVLTWLASRWQSETDALGRKLRSPSHKPAELAVADAVPDVMGFVREVRRLDKDQ